MSDHLLIDQCAPTLAGIKTGSLILSHDPPELLHKRVQQWNLRYSPRGVCIVPLRESKTGTLLYVYRPRMLRGDLQSSGAECILSRLCYPLGKPEKCVARLRRKLSRCRDFPHEIGLFLGYPPEDVEGFIKNEGRNAKCTGCWKVYTDIQTAQETFRRYRSCRRCYRTAFEKDPTIDKLVVSC